MKVRLLLPLGRLAGHGDTRGSRIMLEFDIGLDQLILIATDSGYQVMTSDDYDGDVEKIVREYDFYGV